MAMSNFEGLGSRLRQAGVSASNDTAPERHALRAGASSTVQTQLSQPVGGSFAATLDQTLRRGKARQQIENRGEKAIANQQLKDRLANTEFLSKKRGAITEAGSFAKMLRSGVDAATIAGKDRVSQAKFGAIGSIAGMATSGFMNRANPSDFDHSLLEKPTGFSSTFDNQTNTFDPSSFDFDYKVGTQVPGAFG